MLCQAPDCFGQDLVLLAEGKAQQRAPGRLVIVKNVDGDGRHADLLGQLPTERLRISGADPASVRHDEVGPTGSRHREASLGEPGTQHISLGLERISQLRIHAVGQVKGHRNSRLEGA